MPSKIFVNYRRDDDAAAAARVRDGLAARLGRWLLLGALALVVSCAGAGLTRDHAAAQQPKKLAFVVGIDRYDNLPASAQLKKALGDANAMGEALMALGFAVTPLPEPTRGQFFEAWYKFLEQVAPGDTVAFVFSGHGVELEGANFLLPRDVPRVRLGREGQLRSESIAFGQLLTDLRERRPAFALVVLDACRDNPFEEAGRSVGGRRGLGRVEAPEGTFVMFSAGAGQTALDRLGDADNEKTSIFTRTLLPMLKKPGVNLLDMADQVGEQVRDLAATIGHRQTPAFYSRVIGGRRVCLAGCEVAAATPVPAPVPAPVAPQPPLSAAARDWQDVKGSRNVRVLEAFRDRHQGDPVYVALAEDAIAALRPAPAAANDVIETVFPKPDADRASPGFRPGLFAKNAPTQPPTIASDKVAALTPGSGQSARDCWQQSGRELCGPEMVVVPAGSFMMGSPASEPQRDNDEAQLPVTIAKPVAVGKFSVTFDEWDACVADGGCNGYKPDDNRWGRGKRPVINVNWDDAKAYVAWLASKTGKSYRLLSEAEREYVTRAGTTTPFWWGSSITPAQANYDGNVTYKGGGSKGEYRQRTVPVESFQPNPWGLHNVHGNVWEWTEDCWNDSNSGNPGTGSARASGDCSRRVLRGGSWNLDPRGLRAANRFGGLSVSRGNVVGFRLARSVSR